MFIALCKSNSRTLIGGAINIVTGSMGYYHTEFVFPDGSNVTSMPVGGVQFRRHSYLPREWDFIDVGPLDEDKLRDWVDGEIGCRYDFWGDARFIIPWAKPHPTRWFCSEIDTALLQQAGILTVVPAFKICPNYLFLELVAAGFKVVPIPIQYQDVTSGK